MNEKSDLNLSEKYYFTNYWFRILNINGEQFSGKKQNNGRIFWRDHIPNRNCHLHSGLRCRLIFDKDSSLSIFTSLAEILKMGIINPLYLLRGIANSAEQVFLAYLDTGRSGGDFINNRNSGLVIFS